MVEIDIKCKVREREVSEYCVFYCFSLKKGLDIRAISSGNLVKN